MTAETDLLERMMQDALEQERKYEPRITELRAQVLSRYPWIYSFFRTRVWNAADVEGLVNKTLEIYLADVGATLYLTGGGSNSLDPVVEDGELVALKFPTIPRVTPIQDLERYTFRSPGGWFRTVAQNVLTDYVRRAAPASELAAEISRRLAWPTRRNGAPQRFNYPADLQCFCTPPRNIEQQLIRDCRNREFHARYIEALRPLPPVQRAAWILCRDELLSAAEAEPLLTDILHWRKARAALRARPMLDSEASRRMLRADVSPNASKARGKLREQLSDFNPRPNRAPALQFPPEALASPAARSGSIRSSIYRGGRMQSEVQQDYIDRVAQLSSKQRNPSLPKPMKTRDSDLLAESIPISPGSYRPIGWSRTEGSKIRKMRLDATQRRALDRISYASGACDHCEAHAVRRSFSPRAVGWTFWCYQCGAKDLQCKKNSEDHIGRDAEMIKSEPKQERERRKIGPDYKPFHLLTPTERTQRRIEENKAVDARITSKNAHKLQNVPKLGLRRQRDGLGEIQPDGAR